MTEVFATQGSGFPKNQKLKLPDDVARNYIKAGMAIKELPTVKIVKPKKTESNDSNDTSGTLTDS
jgi:hypothetical protein